MAHNARWRRALAAGAAAAAMAIAEPAATSAQATGTLVGRVTAATGEAIDRARLRFPQLDRAATTDSSGLFRFDGLTYGQWVVIAEAPGYKAQQASIVIDGAPSRHEFTLERSAQVLAGVDVRAKAPPRVSPKMVDFERRRRRGHGRFVTREELERVPGRQLEEVLRAAATGARFVKTAHGQTWLISARQVATNHGLLDNSDPNRLRNTLCYAQVILDGAVISSSTAPRAPRMHPGGEGNDGLNPRSQVQGGDDPVDVNLFFSDQLEGVEYYADATTTPMLYRTPAAVCGTLILWTRDR